MNSSYLLEIVRLLTRLRKRCRFSSPSAYLDRPGLSRNHSYLTCGPPDRAPTRDQTSKISSPTGVRTSYPSSVTTTVFSTPTAPSPGNTTLGSREKTIPTSKE